MPVRTLGARAAYEAMVNPRSGECPPAEDRSSACDWVTVTAARPASAVVLTSRGGATVPATGRRILLFGQDVVSSSDTSLTLALGSGTCDTDVTARVHESDAFDVVGGTALGPEPGTMCTAALRIHEVTVDLASPVGVRAVIDAASGRPLLQRAAEG